MLPTPLVLLFRSDTETRLRDNAKPPKSAKGDNRSNKAQPDLDL
jgi:hypothetical protein